MLDLEKTARQAGLEAVFILENAIRAELFAAKKVATAKTLKSVYGEVTTSGNRILARVYANKSLLFIVKGKRANTKLPVYQSGGRFFLFDEIKQWKRAVGFRGSDYILARAIARNAQKPVPIIANVIKKTQDKIFDQTRNKFSKEIQQNVVTDIRGALRSILR